MKNKIINYFNDKKSFYASYYILFLLFGFRIIIFSEKHTFKNGLLSLNNKTNIFEIIILVLLYLSIINFVLLANIKLYNIIKLYIRFYKIKNKRKNGQ